MTERTTDMDGDLRARVNGLEHTTAANNQRLTTLETWRTQSDIADARKEEQWKGMNDKIDHVGKKVDKISDNMSRIMWLVLSGIIMGVVAFMMRGGFHIPGPP